MTIGLKRGTVRLADHDPQWKTAAAETIRQLWDILGPVAKDIQHVGSTAIAGIKAKPIIDIAVAVDDFAEVEVLAPTLQANGFLRRNAPVDTRLLFAIGEDTDREDRITTHFIHISKTDSIDCQNSVNFRDYLNAMPNIANEYEDIKIRLAEENPIDEGRAKYLAGKHDFIIAKLDEARIWADFDKKFVNILSITKGWSDDKKYRVKTADGQNLLLRISDISEHDRKNTEYEVMARAYSFGITAPQPVEFGLCNNGQNVYSLSGWLEGEDAQELLPRLSEAEQYATGLKAGELLRKIHTLPAPDDAESWHIRFDRKVQDRIDFYNANPIKSENGDLLVRYLQSNKNLLIHRPQTFNHGDYNVSNIIIMPDGQTGVIDFNYYNGNHGDPWWEFDPSMDGNGSDPAVHFYSGIIKGYFDGKPLREFFNVFSYYQAYDALASLCDTSVNNQGEPEDGMRHVENILRWYDNMQNTVPSWYLENFHVQWIDGIPCKLKSPFDFSFLSKYGKVFKIFDEQDSGNICFGVQNPDGKFFVKFAGAPTEQANVSQSEAIARMKATVPIYRDLAHPVLANLISVEEIGGGYAMLFHWTDADCMGKLYPQSREKFLQMPTSTRLQVLDDILDFHAHVARQGYVAIDFYDGCIMYDFDTGKTILCDIELYEKMPYVNRMGRMYGSGRFMSPEEFELGAAIDEITNVYTMGATAFEFFGDNRDRCFEKWSLSRELFDVAKRATSDDRGQRQQTIAEFIAQWKAAKPCSQT